MPGRRFQSSLRPINSLKHIIETNGSVSAGTKSTNDIVVADANPDPEVSPTKVTIGSKVNAIYLRVEVIGRISAGGVDNIYMVVFKNPGGDIVLGDLDSLGINRNRKWVIHQEMIMLTPIATDLASAFGFPRTFFKGVIVIPPKMRRFGIDDKLQVVLQHRGGEATQTTEFCLECIYKEFR